MNLLIKESSIMRKTLFLLIFAAICASVKSQDTSLNKKTIDVEILNADSLIKGIYIDFGEFQNNSPTIRNAFTINKKNPWISYNYDNANTSKLLVLNSANSLMPYLNDYWGICDGKRIFICFHGKFRLLSIEGKYCQFSELQVTTQIDMNFSYNRDYNFVLDVTQNKIIRLNVNSLTDILQKEDANLLNEFNNEKDKKMMLSTYINRLNNTYNYK